MKRSATRSFILPTIAFIIIFILLLGSVLSRVYGAEIPGIDATSTSTAKDAVESRSARPMSIVTTKIKVIPILSLQQGSAGAMEELATVVAGYERDGVSAISNRLCRGKISAPNTNVRSTETVQQLIDVEAEGGDQIALSDIIVESVSTGGALNDLYTVGNRGYSSAAVGYRRDGSAITSGPPTQTVQRIIFITQMKLFNDQPSIVESWVNGWQNFTISYLVKCGNGLARGSVSILGYDNNLPKLIINGRKIHLVDADVNRPYHLLISSEVVGPYRTLATMYNDDLYDLNQEGTRFFRIRDSGW